MRYWHKKCGEMSIEFAVVDRIGTAPNGRPIKKYASRFERMCAKHHVARTPGTLRPGRRR